MGVSVPMVSSYSAKMFSFSRVLGGASSGPVAAAGTVPVSLRRSSARRPASLFRTKHRLLGIAAVYQQRAAPHRQPKPTPDLVGRSIGPGVGFQAPQQDRVVEESSSETVRVPCRLWCSSQMLRSVTLSSARSCISSRTGPNNGSGVGVYKVSRGKPLKTILPLSPHSRRACPCGCRGRKSTMVSAESFVHPTWECPVPGWVRSVIRKTVPARMSRIAPGCHGTAIERSRWGRCGAWPR